MVEDPLELVGVLLDEHYRVDGFVGEGELSLTYRGHDLENDAPVAIRCLNLPLTLDLALAGPFVDSFQARTRIYRRLAPGNSNFVQILGAGTTTAPDSDRRVPYEIREWFEATTLATYCAKWRSEGHEGWPLDEVLTVLAPVADGLAYAHDVGVTHAEINPNNLLVAEVMGRTVVKIVDFGEARSAGDKSAEAPVLRVLEPAYAAPELVDKQLGPMGTWTDVYSLAVIVLECLAGTLGTRNVAAAVVVDPEHRVSAKKLGLKLPKDVEEVLDRALALEPGQRPKDIASFWRQLRAAAAPSSAPMQPKEAAPAPNTPPSKLVTPPKTVTPPLAAQSKTMAPKPVAPSKPSPPRLPAAAQKPSLPRPPPLSPASPPSPLSPASPPAAPVETVHSVPPASGANPLVKATLFGLQPTRLPQEPRVSAPPDAEFTPDEAPTRRREPSPQLLEAKAASPPLDGVSTPLLEAPQEGDATSKVEEPRPVEEPEVFLPALMRPTIGQRLMLSFAWLARHGWPWLVARAKDPAPRARFAFGASTLGGFLFLMFTVSLCVRSGSPAPEVPAASLPQSSPQSSARAAQPEPLPSAPASPPIPLPAAAPASAPAPARSDIPSAATTAAPASPGVIPPGPLATFTRALAGAALEAAGGDLSDCKTLGSIRGTGSIRATFNKSGEVAKITIGPPYADTPEGACILDRFGRAQLSPFRGPAGAVNYTFNLPK
jgi:serine/threonine-protein kinase